MRLRLPLAPAVSGSGPASGSGGFAREGSAASAAPTGAEP
jgi:hypothetical protein